MRSYELLLGFWKKEFTECPVVAVSCPPPSKTDSGFFSLAEMTSISHSSNRRELGKLHSTRRQFSVARFVTTPGLLRPHAVLWLSYTLVHDDLKIVKHALLTPFIREACKKIPYVNTLVVQAHRHRPDYTSVANYPMIVSGVLPADRCPSSTQDDPFFYCGCGPGRSSC